MKVKMLTVAAGPKFSGRPGQIVEVDDALGKDLISGNYAVAVEDKPKPEPVEETTEVVEEVETTSSPEPKPRTVKRGERGRPKGGK